MRGRLTTERAAFAALAAGPLFVQKQRRMVTIRFGGVLLFANCVCDWNATGVRIDMRHIRLKWFCVH